MPIFSDKVCSQPFKPSRGLEGSATLLQLPPEHFLKPVEAVQGRCCICRLQKRCFWLPWASECLIWPKDITSTFPRKLDVAIFFTRKKFTEFWTFQKSTQAADSLRKSSGTPVASRWGQVWVLSSSVDHIEPNPWMDNPSIRRPHLYTH